MKTLVVYDSVYGNTETIAKAVATGLGNAPKVRVSRAAGLGASDIADVDLLVVGAPTQGGRPTKPVQDFLAKIEGASLGGKKVAAFDTRIPGKFATIFGYAATRIARMLEKSGGKLVVPPEGFFVRGKEGPIKEGESERATQWAKTVLAASAKV